MVILSLSKNRRIFHITPASATCADGHKLHYVATSLGVSRTSLRSNFTFLYRLRRHDVFATWDMMYLALRGIAPRCCRGSVESLTQRSSGLPCLAPKLIVSFAFYRSVHRLVRVALARYACKRHSLRSPSPLPARELGLPVAEILNEHFYCDDSRPLACLALKLSFHSRLIVAFIGSFAMPLLSVVRKSFSLRSPFPPR